MSQQDSKSPVPAEGTPRCSLLRSKGMYLPPNPLADQTSPEGSATAVFWCLKTMKMVGPDDSSVDPRACVPGRSCFRAPL